MIFTRVLRLVLFVVLLSLVAFPAIAQETTPVPEQRTIYPVTIESCGRTLTFTETPTRVFVDYQTQLELMLRLGLGEYIAGYTGVGEVPLMSDVANAFSQIEGRATYWESFPAREQAVTAGYDLAIFAFPAYVYDTARGRATREEWEQNGTIVYESNADCIDSDVVRTIEDSYQQIRDIGRIFNVEDRAEALIDEMQQIIEMVSSRVDGLPAPRTAILDYIDENGIPYFYAAGIYTDLIELAGGENVFADQQQQYAEINPEVVAERPVDVLFVMQWEGTISAEEKAEYYFATFPNAPVSQSRRFAVLTNIELNAGSGNAIAVEKMARALHPDAFAEASATPVAAAQTQYPVTIESCGETITVTARPERAVGYWTGQTSIMVALGAADSIIGRYYFFESDVNVPPPAIADAVFSIPLLGNAGEAPSREAVVAAQPDFYYAGGPDTFPEDQASREDWASVGAIVYNGPASCAAPEDLTIELLYEEIMQVGVIFDAQAEAAVLIQGIRDQIASVQEKIAGREPVTVAWIDGYSADPIYVLGDGYFTDVLRQAGGINLFVGANYGTPPSLEEYAVSNPDVLLIFSYGESTDEFIPRYREVFATSTAVQNDRVGTNMYLTSLRTGELVEQVARVLHPEAFADATATPVAASQTQYPLTIENCGRTLTFDAPPQRVLATWQNTGEIMLALGLEDKLVGVYFGQPYAALPEYEGQYDSFSIFPQRQIPSRELIVSAEADFVFAAYPTFDFSAENGLVTAEEFLEAGANVYGLTDQCIDNPQTFSLDNLYQDILNIGIIFDVQAQAQAVVADMQGRIAAVQERVSGREPVDVIMVDRGNGPIGVWGRGYESVLIELAGGRNLYGDADGSYVEVGIEAFTTQDPDLLVVYDYEDAEGVPDEAEYAAFLFETFPNMRPSQEQRYALIGAETNTGIRAPLAVERLAQQFHPEAFE